MTNGLGGYMPEGKSKISGIGRSAKATSPRLTHDFYFSNFLATELFIDDSKIFANRVANVLHGFLLCRALGPTSRKARNGNADAFF